MSDEYKPQPKTTELAPPTAAEILVAEFRVGMKSLREDFGARFDTVDDRLDKMQHVVASVTDEMASVKSDLAEFKGETREKLRTHSIPIREASNTDMRHDAAIGTLVADVKELKESVSAGNGLTEDVKKLVVEGAKSPTVKLWGGRIAMAVGFLILGYIGLLQKSIEAKQADIKASTDKAPSVIVVPLFDAGGSDAK